MAVTQEGFRWRNDDGSETSATWKAAQDTNVSASLTAAKLRLRLLLDAASDPPPAAYTLRYKKSTDSTWIPVPVGTGGSTASVVYDAFTGTNGAAWSGSLWTDIAVQASSVVDIQSNAGRMANAGTPYPASRVRSTLSKGDCDWAFKVSFDSTNEFYFVVGWCTGTSWGGNGSTYEPLAGYGFEYQFTGDTLFYEYNGAGGRTQIGGTSNVGASAATRWIRVQTIGSAIKVKTWLASGAEPGTWNFTTTDSTWTSGYLTLTMYGGSSGATRTATIDDVTDNLGTIPAPVYIATSSNVTGGGQDTTAQLAAPSGKTTADFRTGRMWDDENGTEIYDLGESEASVGSFTETFTNLNKWTAARQRSQSFTLSPSPVGYLQDFGPSLVDNVVPPNDVIVSSGQVWIGCGSQNYGDTYIRCNQPFNFPTSGIIQFDAWIPPTGEFLKGWPHVTVTELPYTAPSAKVDNSGGPTARYGFEVRLNHDTAVFSGSNRPAPQVLVWDEHAETVLTGGAIGLNIVSTPHTMTTVRIEFTHSHIDVYANNVLWYAHDWTLPTALTDGYVYLASHNHASIKYGFGPNTYAVYDNFSLSDSFALRRCGPPPTTSSYRSPPTTPTSAPPEQTSAGPCPPPSPSLRCRPG